MNNNLSTSEKMPETVCLLGIDYGATDVGLALADSETKIAFAYATIRNDKNLLQKIAEIARRENVEKIIIGIPSYVNRREIEYEGEKLGKFIRNILPETEIFYQNEMFTTKMAQDNLIARGTKGVKKFDDQEAARIILQEWLDKEKNHEE